MCWRPTLFISPSASAGPRLLDVLGDRLIDSGGPGRVEEVAGLLPLVEGTRVAVEALVGGSVIILASHSRTVGKELLQRGLLLWGGFEERFTLFSYVCRCEVGGGVAHDEGVFGQKAILEQPPDGGLGLLG